MMYSLQPSLALDLTGYNKDNLISNEPHSLSKNEFRALVPKRGLFYSGTVVIMDKAKRLILGEDYQFTELHQDLTSKTGKAVFAGIIIKNQGVGSEVTISYQAVGGPYTTDNEAIRNMYESFLKDTRPVSWGNIYDKPLEFPPTAHNHFLEDVQGWEPIIYQLERIRNTMERGQMHIVKGAVNALLNRFDCGELPKILPSDKIVQYDALTYFTTRRKLDHNKVWIDVEDCLWKYGRTYHFDIDTSEFPKGHRFYWKMYKQDGAVINLPMVTNGIVIGTGAIVRTYVNIPVVHSHESEVIYIGVNSKPFEKEFEAVTYRIHLGGANGSINNVSATSPFSIMTGASKANTDTSNRTALSESNIKDSTDYLESSLSILNKHFIKE